MPPSGPGYVVLATLLAFIAASVWLGTLAQRALDKRKFLEGFFLGNRGLGAWTLALTATVQSGGTFMGFPALVYDHGWVVTLWIGSYMVVPLTGFAIVGKRLAQLSRRFDAITVPDLFGRRFADPRISTVASLLIIFFLSFTMIAQFKAGATIMKLALPGVSEGFTFAEFGNTKVDFAYIIGLTVFSVTVIGYTAIGGFLAGVWTDLFQSVMMVIGVAVLVCLAVPAAGGMQAATLEAMKHTSADYAFAPGYEPGGRQFLPLGLAFSMFFVWVFAGFATPASMIRVMAAQNTDVMRKSIFLLAVYNCLIYVPLIMIAVSARALLPNLKQADEAIPQIAMLVTQGIPLGSLITGLILAAPFGAIMASVSCFILVISSGLVQDLYLNLIHPTASPRRLQFISRLSMVIVGLIGFLAACNPPKYLQAFVVFSGSAGAATFVTPALMACYWRRATAAGTLASMLFGFGTYFLLFAIGWIHNWALAQGASPSGMAGTVLSLLGPDTKLGLASAFRPYFLLGLDPILWGMAVSAVAGIGVSLITTPPPAALISQIFDAPASEPSPSTAK